METAFGSCSTDHLHSNLGAILRVSKEVVYWNQFGGFVAKRENLEVNSEFLCFNDILSYCIYFYREVSRNRKSPAIACFAAVDRFFG